mgnify:CR=1 FL=1
MDVNPSKKPAFSLMKKDGGNLGVEKKAEAEKPVDSKFNFIKEKEVEKVKAEQKKKDEIPEEMLEIMDADALGADT